MPIGEGTTRNSGGGSTDRAELASVNSSRSERSERATSYSELPERWMQQAVNEYH
jgi:hypothetical protein